MLKPDTARPMELTEQGQAVVARKIIGQQVRFSFACIHYLLFYV